jgi:MoaA/NifB/PqqE/SkfB family radical SAM enzyme
MRQAIERKLARWNVVYGRKRLELWLASRYLRDGWAAELVRCRTDPTYVPAAPVTIGIELTNACQLRCPHCDAQHPAIRGKAGYMREDTFVKLRDQLRALRLRNLRLIGGGEPLLHPRFAEWVPQLRGLASLVSVTTNGQRLTPENTRAALEALDVIEVSVASDHAEGFQRSRTGGDFDELLENLERLRVLRRQLRSRTRLHVRVMIRPSELRHVDRLLAFWSRYGDAVSTQRLQDYFGQDGDVFVRGVVEMYPRCALPFRALGVGWDGEVPLCRTSAFQVGDPQGLRLGNVHDMTLAEIWDSTVIRQYRDAHRERDLDRMPTCRGCPDPQRPAWHKVFDTNAHFTRAAEAANGFVPLRALSPAARRAGAASVRGHSLAR